MIKKHCLVLPLVWTLFQLSYVLCNKLSPVQNNELATRIKHYAELYGYYKTAECVALLAVTTPEINWNVTVFNYVIRDTKKQIYVKNALEYLNKLKKDSNWKNVNYLSQLYEHHLNFSKTVQEKFHRNAAKVVASKLGNKKSKIDLTTVFNNFTKSLGNAWAARKDLYTTAAVNFATANKLVNPKIINESVLLAEEDLQVSMEKEFVQSRDNVERKCFQMSGMQLDRNAVDEFLTKSNSTNEKISEFKNAVVQMISEVQKFEKFRIDRFPRQIPLSIIITAVNTMFREGLHEFGRKDK
ncbi:unnamed protein product [Trichobilharzia szidati]|nr:unnamed protein product [Trichobilharzia szidati]